MCNCVFSGQLESQGANTISIGVGMSQGATVISYVEGLSQCGTATFSATELRRMLLRVLLERLTWFLEDVS